MKPAPDCADINHEAISAAFAVVACADAELAESEIARFRDIIRDAEACQGLDLESIEASFQRLSQAMLEDYGAGKHRALEIIAKTRDDPPSRDRVLAAAQVAVVADGALQEVEEQVLRELCHLLGVDPEDY